MVRTHTYFQNGYFKYSSALHPSTPVSQSICHHVFCLISIGPPTTVPSAPTFCTPTLAPAGLSRTTRRLVVVMVSPLSNFGGAFSRYASALQPPNVLVSPILQLICHQVFLPFTVGPPMIEPFQFAPTTPTFAPPAASRTTSCWVVCTRSPIINSTGVGSVSVTVKVRVLLSPSSLTTCTRYSPGTTICTAALQATSVSVIVSHGERCSGTVKVSDVPA